MPRRRSLLHSPGWRSTWAAALIKGIGPVTARRIVAHFGLETLDIIEQSCSRLIEVTGIGEKRVAMIEKAWAAQQAIKEVMLFLRGHNVSTTYAVKIYKQYGDQAIEVVSKIPINWPPIFWHRLRHCRHYRAEYRYRSRL